MYKSRSMFQDVSVHSRRIYKTYSLAVGRNIYKPVIWGDSARCVFCWTRCNNEMLNWSFTRPHVMKTMIGWRVRYCHRAVSPSGVPLDEFWAPATKSGISILLLSFKQSISKSHVKNNDNYIRPAFILLYFLLKTNVNAHCLCLYLSVWHVFFFCLYMPPPIWDSCKFCVFLGFSPLGKIFSFLLPSTSLHLKTKINS